MTHARPSGSQLRHPPRGMNLLRQLRLRRSLHPSPVPTPARIRYSVHYRPTQPTAAPRANSLPPRLTPRAQRKVNPWQQPPHSRSMTHGVPAPTPGSSPSPSPWPPSWRRSTPPSPTSPCPTSAVRSPPAAMKPPGSSPATWLPMPSCSPSADGSPTASAASAST